jgi:hypothetical protein
MHDSFLPIPFHAPPANKLSCDVLAWFGHEFFKLGLSQVFGNEGRHGSFHGPFLGRDAFRRGFKS